MMMFTTALTLPRGGVEYLHWDTTGLPALPPVGAVQVSFDQVAWHPATLVGSRISILVAHESVPAPDPEAVVVRVGRREMLVKLSDTPEVVIRSGGWLDVSP